MTIHLLLVNFQGQDGVNGLDGDPGIQGIKVSVSCAIPHPIFVPAVEFLVISYMLSG